MKRFLALLFVVIIALVCLVSCNRYDEYDEYDDENKTPLTNKELITERIETFLTAYNTGDMDTVLECLDAKRRNAFQAMLNLLGGLAGSMTGFDIDLSDLFSLGVNTTSGDFMELEITDIVVIDSESATATTKMFLTGVGTQIIYFEMVYENNGWYIHDMTDRKPTGTHDTENDDVIHSYVLSTYSSTDEYGNAGTFSEINKQYNVGDTIKLEATVNSGYNFVGWFINGTCVSEDLKYTYTMKSRDIDIEARYNYYTVHTSSDSDDYERAGTYTELKKEKISVGEQVTVEATVNDGYNFEGWYIKDVCVSEDLTYSFTMKSKNVELEAKFSSYTLTTYSDSNLEGTVGTYTQINEKKVSVGDTITLIAQTAQGCNFEGWYIWPDVWNSICVCEDVEYTFEMGKEDVRIEARFTAYTLTTGAFLMTANSKLDTITPGINIKFFWTYDWSAYDPSMGDFTQYKNTYIAAGEEITLTATEKSGYTFFGWKRGYDLISTSHTYTFVMDKSDATYEAVYIIKNE